MSVTVVCIPQQAELIYFPVGISIYPTMYKLAIIYIKTWSTLSEIMTPHHAGMISQGEHGALLYEPKALMSLALSTEINEQMDWNPLHSS